MKIVTRQAQKYFLFFITTVTFTGCSFESRAHAKDSLVNAFESQPVHTASALYRYADSLVKMNTDNDPFYNAVANKWKAFCFLKYANYELADSLVNASIKILEISVRSVHLLDAMLLKGQIEENKGNLDLAYDWYLKSLNVAQKENEKYFISRAMLFLGDIFYDLHQFESAKKYFYRAQSYTREEKREKIKGAALMRLGNIALSENKLQEAISFYQNSISNFEKISDLVSAAADKMNIGVCYEKMDEHEKANEIFNRVLFTFYDQEEYLLAGNCLFNIGNVYGNKGNLKEALHYYNECLVLAGKTKNKILFARVYEQLSDVYSAFGDPKNAFHYLNLYKTETDSLLNGKMVQRVHEAEMKFETDRKNLEIQKIQNEKRIAEAESRNNENIRNFLIGGIILLFIIIMLVWFNLRQRLHNRELLIGQNKKDFDSKLDELISEQEQNISDAMIETQITERKRIAADLHDRVGSMLSAAKHFLNAGLSDKKSKDELFSKALNLIDESTGEIRNISQNLEFDPEREFGLVRSLESLCEHLNGVSSTSIFFSSHLSEDLPDQKIEIAVFRIAQELLANAIKHAKSPKIEMQLNIHSHSLNLIVQDFGTGFDEKKNPDERSMGLRNIKNRLAEWNGKIHIDSSKNRGTTVIIELEF
ncbi:MAG: ATP-binding protein [Bacteroidia bacterium]